MKTKVLWDRVILATLIFVFLLLILIKTLNLVINDEKNDKIVVKQDKTEEKVEIIAEKEQIIEEKQEISQKTYLDYRLTSFYSSDGMGTGSCTGSGLCESDFSINEYGWYTYEGKLVLAAATTYLLNYGYDYVDGRIYFRYYNEVKIIIDGIEYTGIILDSCGASMYLAENRLDLFVASRESVKDTQIQLET